MAAALKFAGWDYQFVLGGGTHNGNHGASIFPDTMRWLWQDTIRTPMIVETVRAAPEAASS